MRVTPLRILLQVLMFAALIAAWLFWQSSRANAQDCLPPDAAIAKVTSGHPAEQIVLDHEQTAAFPRGGMHSRRCPKTISTLP